MYYATLHEVRRYLKFTATQTTDDTLLQTFIRQSQRTIDVLGRRYFAPLKTTYYQNYPIEDTAASMGTFGVFDSYLWVSQMNAVSDLSVGRLQLDHDLLALTTVTNGDGTTVSSDDYVLTPDNFYPKHSIVLKRGSGIAWQRGSNDATEQVISLLGTWGYHTDWSNAWVDTLDTLQAGIDATTTSFTVSDADGVAGDLQDTRFQAGNLIKIESEYLEVISVNTTTNVLTVTRGARGTTAAAHDAATSIYVYRPEGDITLAHIRMVAWRYRQKDSDTFDRTAILGSGSQVIPSAVPPDIAALIPVNPGRYDD